MFAGLLQTDFFEIIENGALDAIKADRLKYKPIFDLIIKTISDDINSVDSLHKDKIIFSDINKILGEADESIPDKIIMYTTHARKMATAIANIIHKKFGKLVQMRSLIPNEEYDIIYNMRNVAKIHRIERYKTVTLDILFNAVKIDNILYFPVEIELIDIYRKLYLPNFNKEWSSLTASEDKLYKLVDGKAGGAKKCGECKVKRKLDIYQIKLLMINFLNNETYTMIGTWAHRLINKEPWNDDDTISIISENEIEHDNDVIVSYLSSFTNYGISYKKKKLFIPKDNRIYKYTFYIKYPTFGKDIIDKPFLDIYNCGSYELIPFELMEFEGNNLKVGSVFVQMRFIMIDLWLLRLVKYLDGIDDITFETKKKYLYETLHNIREKRPGGLVSYMGINFSENVAQKIEISKKQIKKDSYYPELSMKDTKKYKLIATS